MCPFVGHMKDIVNLKKEAEVSQKKVRELESEKSKLNAVSSFTITPDPQITLACFKASQQPFV